MKHGMILGMINGVVYYYALPWNVDFENPFHNNLPETVLGGLLVDS